MIVWIVTHLALAVAFAFVCHGVGRLLVRDDGAAATAFGYGILGQLLFALAALGMLTRTNAAILFGIAAVVSLPSLRRRVAFSRLQLFVAFGSIPGLIIAIYPPVGYDATMYHLVYARLFAESGRLVYADALRFPVFPQLAEMHFTAALLLIGERAAQLTQWIALPVTALSAARLVRAAGGGERAELLAAALWLGTPYAVYLSGSGYIDVSLAMMVTAGFAAARPGLAGAFAGLAAATKYHGLFFIAALARRRGALVFLAAAALFAAPWYIHITRATGNPLFPYLRGIFGDHEYRTNIDQSMLDAIADPRSAVAALPAETPVQTVVRRALLEPIRLGVSPHSPLLVLLLPFAAAGAVIAPALRRPLLAAAVYVLIVATLDWRFLIVIVPLLAAAIALPLDRLLSPRLARAAALLLLLPGFAWGSLLIMVKYGPMPVTPAERDTFVAGRIGVYRAVRSLGPTTVYVLGAPQMAYYCPGRCLGDERGPYRFQRIEPLLPDPPRLAHFLRGFGATHFVVDKEKYTFRPAVPFRLVYEDARAAAYAVGP